MALWIGTGRRFRRLWCGLDRNAGGYHGRICRLWGRVRGDRIGRRHTAGGSGARLEKTSASHAGRARRGCVNVIMNGCWCIRVRGCQSRRRGDGPGLGGRGGGSGRCRKRAIKRSGCERDSGPGTTGSKRDSQSQYGGAPEGQYIKQANEEHTQQAAYQNLDRDAVFIRVSLHVTTLASCTARF